MQVWHSHIYNNTRFISTVIKGRSAYRVVINQVDSGTVQNREEGVLCLFNAVHRHDYSLSGAFFALTEHWIRIPDLMDV
jgi:hypothetical protein